MTGSDATDDAAEPTGEVVPGATGGADAELASPAQPAGDGANELDEPLTSADYSVAFSPRNVAVGLAIVAGLVAVVAARRRRRPGREDD